MRNNFIRNSFLVACASFTLSNAYAMEPLQYGRYPVVYPVSTTVEDQWTIKVYKNHNRQQKYFSTLIDIASEKNEDFINFMLIGQIKNSNDIFIDIIPRLSQNPKIFLNISDDLKATNIVYQEHAFHRGWNINCKDKVTPEKFLSVFYNRDLIPDCLTNHIVQPFDIKDFRNRNLNSF